MRSWAPRLVLQGDTRRTKTWIPWASKWLDRLKNVLGQSVPINKSAWVVPPRHSQGYKKPGGIFVHVKTVQGIDTIRIFAQPIIEVGCLDSAKYQFVVTGLDVEFTPDIELCFGKYHWDFGDNQYAFTAVQGNPYTHTYTRPGTYSVKLTAYETDPLNTDSEDIEVTYEDYHGSMGDRTWPSSFNSHAEAYANTFALGWEPGVPFSLYEARYVEVPGLPFLNNWTVMLARDVGFGVPFSQIASNPSVVSGKAFVYIWGDWTAYTSNDDDGASKPFVSVLSGSNPGMTTYEKKDSSSDSMIATMVDITEPLVDSIYAILDQSDIFPPAIMPDPQTMTPGLFFDSWSGWHCNNLVPNVFDPGFRRLRVLPYSKKKELTKIVTVV